MKLILLLAPLLLVGCSLYSSEKNMYPFGHEKKMVRDDYERHLIRLSDLYIQQAGKKIVKLKNRNQKYFNKLQKRLTENNENILKEGNEANVYIVKDNRPFYFSTPGHRIFFSSGLIKKYVKNEDLFASIFTTEYLRSNLSIFKKIVLIPHDNVTLNKMLKVTSLDLKTKVDLNNLTYEVMKRSGFDPEAKLLWLQMENRNSIDFSLQYENSSMISTEEFYIKNYIVKQEKIDTITFEKNSSREFYQFRRFVERI